MVATADPNATRSILIVDTDTGALDTAVSLLDGHKVYQVRNVSDAQRKLVEEGIELAVESFKMNASGEVVANLNALEANAAASGESVGVLNVKTVDGTERVEIDRAVQVRMTVTYDLPETEEAEAAAAEEAEEVEAAMDAEEEAGEKLEAQE